MKKLPRFLKRRWHGIPVGLTLVTVLLVLALTSGSVVAWYTTWTGTASVTVKEPLRVDFYSLSSGNYSNLDWTVSMFPGEEWLRLKVTNSANVTIPVTPTASPSGLSGCGGQVTYGWTYLNGTWQDASGGVDAVAESVTEFKFTVNVSSSCPIPLCDPFFMLGFAR